MQVRVGDSYIREQRLVMMAMLARPLLPGERVLHRNRNKLDNDPLNLELRVGSAITGDPADEIACPHCGLPWLGEVPINFAMPVDEVARRIADGEWSAVDSQPFSGVPTRLGKPLGVRVRLAGRATRTTAPIAGQVLLFDPGEAA
jgi:hypothetical protein